MAACGGGARQERDVGSGVLRKHGVKEPVFYWWRAELARRDATKPLEAFVPVVVQPATSGHVEGIMIELRGGRVLRLPAMPVVGWWNWSV